MKNAFLALVLSVLILPSFGCGGGAEKPDLSKKPIAETAKEPEKAAEPAAAEAPAEEAKPAEEAAAEPKAAASGGLKINSVSADELAAAGISGMGKATAQKIIDFRDANGPFGSYEDLDKAPGVGPAMLEKLQAHGMDFGGGGSAAAKKEEAPATDKAAAEEPAAPPAPASKAKAELPAGTKVNINKASAEELQKVKGIGPSMAQKIIDYRKANGPFKSVDDLDNVSGIGPATLDKMRDFITVK